MVNAYVSAGNYSGGAVGGGAIPPSDAAASRSCLSSRPGSVCLRRVDRAAAQLRSALDTVAPKDFRPYQGTPTVVSRHRRGRKRVRLSGRPRKRRQGARPGGPGAAGSLFPAGVETGDPKGRRGDGPCWASCTPPPGARPPPCGRSGRARPKPGGWHRRSKRKHIVHTGATAAIGLFTGLAADSTALTSCRRCPGSQPPRRSAPCSRSAGETRRRLAGLSRSRTPFPLQAHVQGVTDPYAAQAYYLLGDYETTLRVLEGYPAVRPPDRRLRFRLGNAGAGPAITGRGVRAAGPTGRGARASTARSWPNGSRPNPALQPFLHQARRGLARVGMAG